MRRQAAIAVTLDIAGIVLQLVLQDEAAGSQVQTFFAGFVTQALPIGRLQVELLPEAKAPPPGQVALPTGHVVDRRFETSWIRCEGWYQLDRGIGECQVQGCFGLQHFLWSLFTVLLPAHDGLIVHASSVSDGRWGYLFPAPSGTGKSTTVRNSPGYRLLSDEASLIRFVDGDLFAYSSPFRSELYQQYESYRVPVAGLFFLKQALVDQLRPIGEAEALQRLLGEIFLVASDPGSRRLTFTMADHLVRQVRSFELALQNGPDFWRCITNEMDRKTHR